MSYYKITFESDTIEGLKAIQGRFLGHGASATDSTTFETTVPPPRQQDEDAFSGVVPAPPPTADETGASLDKNAFYPPPPKVTDSAIGLEGEIPPPPNYELQDQQGNETQPDEGFVPPPKSASKSPKAAKKRSK
jgi:hypothetical protein